MHQQAACVLGGLLLCVALLPPSSSSTADEACDSNSGQCAWQEQGEPPATAAAATLAPGVVDPGIRTDGPGSDAGPAGDPAPALAAPNSSLIQHLQADLDSALRELQALKMQVHQLSSIVESHQAKIGQLSQLPHTGSGPESIAARRLSTVSPGAPGSAWLEHFLLLSVLKHPVQATDPDSATPAHPVAAPLFVDLSQPATERAPRHVVLGGAAGKASIYSIRGGLVAHVDTGSTSRITAVASYPLKRNETVLVTGHANGEVRLMSVIHAGAEPVSGKAKAGIPSGGILQTRLKAVLAPGIGKDGTQQLSTEKITPIAQIVPVRSGSRQTVRKHIAVWDESGWFRLLRDNSSVRIAVHANRTLLASSQSGVLLVSLSATHAMAYKQPFSHVYKAVPCAGLNGTRMVAATFDPARPHRAFAINDAGKLLMLSVPHESKTNACRVLRAYALAELQPRFSRIAAAQSSAAQDGAPSSNTQPDTSSQPGNDPGTSAPAASSGTPTAAAVSDAPVRLAALRGYLLVTHASGGLLLNVSSLKLPTDALLAEQWSVLTGMLEPPGSNSSAPTSPGPPPVSTSAVGGGLVLLGLPGGALAVMESELPVVSMLQQSSTAAGNKNVWAQPIFIGAMMVVGMWQFFKARGRAGSHSPLQYSSRSMGAGMGAFQDMSDLQHQARVGRPGGRARDVMRDAALHARTAQRQQHMSVRDILQSRGELDIADEEEEEQDVLQGMRPSGSGMQVPNSSRTAYGGFTGPRSIRRAMKMGVTPITEETQSEIQPDE